MPADFWQVLATTGPGAIAVIATVFVMLFFEEKREKRREENAKAKAMEDRAHEIQMQKMWGDNVELIVKKMDETFKLIADNLSDHDKAEEERYKKMHITQDLVKMAEEYARRQGDK